MIAFSVQGGMLMPIKDGAKLRSPRAHAAAATQEISDYWEVDWPNIKLLVVPLADGRMNPFDPVAASQLLCSSCIKHDVRSSFIRYMTGYKRFGTLQGHHWSLLIYINQDGEVQGFYHFDSQPGEEHRQLAAEAASYFAPLVPGCVRVHLFMFRIAMPLHFCLAIPSLLAF
jgi:hypothetical protein